MTKNNAEIIRDSCNDFTCEKENIQKYTLVFNHTFSHIGN